MPGPHKLQVWKSLFKPITRLVRVDSAGTVAEHIDLAPAKHFINSLGIEFVQIPAGSFMMGFRDSPEKMTRRMAVYFGIRQRFGKGDATGLPKSYPRHLVVISKPFFMQTTEVTRAQWLQVMGKKTWNCDFSFSDRPVIVDYPVELNAFIAAMNRRDKGKYRYRLPTEAEWEYAARAGTTSLFFTGENLSPDQAAYSENDREFHTIYYKGHSRKDCTEVKSFPPNPWGLYDTIGNAWEACADSLDIHFYTRSPIVDPVCKGSIFKSRVKRGGNYIKNAFMCASAYRLWYDKKPKYHARSGGIRLVAEPISIDHQALK